MRLEIDSDKIYQIISEDTISPTPRDRTLDLLSSLNGIDIPVSSEKIRKKTIHIPSRHLPTPFRSVWGVFGRENVNYSGVLHFSLNDHNSTEGRNCLNAIEGKMEETYGENWMPIGDGGGYILIRGAPIIEIGKRNDRIPIRLIGNDGSLSRDFRSYDVFGEECMLLEKVATTYINAGINNAVQRGEIKINPNLTVRLSP